MVSGARSPSVGGASRPAGKVYRAWTLAAALSRPAVGPAMGPPAPSRVAAFDAGRPDLGPHDSLCRESMTPLQARRCTKAYTLLEMLVAMTIFAIVSAATAFALSAGVRSYQAIRARDDGLGEGRAILARLATDLRGAYAATGDPSTRFVAQGDPSGDLIVLTTLAHRIQASPSGGSGSAAGADPYVVADSALAPAQSAVALVRYQLDPDTHELLRAEVAVPPSLVIPSDWPPPVTMSRRVASVSLEFTDSSGASRMDWNYQVQSGSGAAAGGASSVRQDAYDTTLPVSARVSVEVLGPDGETLRLSRAVALSMPAPLPAGQKPPATTAATGGR